MAYLYQTCVIPLAFAMGIEATPCSPRNNATGMKSFSFRGIMFGMKYKIDAPYGESRRACQSVLPKQERRVCGFFCVRAAHLAGVLVDHSK